MIKKYEIRDPVYGFIEIDSWERDIIDHPVFQRLRRIKQLAWTDMVYPGAVHTRFEHSLGVMHLATKMYEKIVNKKKDYLINKLGFNDNGLELDKKLVRFACLLHDVGHSPFSHAGEELMDINPVINRDTFLPPTSLENINNYLSWDDWKVFGLLSQGKGGEDGYALRKRKHHRCVFYNSEVPTEDELDQSNTALNKLSGLVKFVDEPEKSWYSMGEKDIMIERNSKETVPLSSLSSVVKGLSPIRQRRIYVSKQDQNKARLELNKKEG